MTNFFNAKIISADNEQVSRGVATHPGEGMSIKPLVHFHCVLHEKYGWGDIQLFLNNVYSSFTIRHILPAIHCYIIKNVTYHVKV